MDAFHFSVDKDVDFINHCVVHHPRLRGAFGAREQTGAEAALRAPLKGCAAGPSCYAAPANRRTDVARGREGELSGALGMLLEIHEFLEGSELSALRDVAAQGPFVDGRDTAGLALQDLKVNEQLKPTQEQIRIMNEILQRAMERSRQFHRFAWPHRVSTPLISRYRPGMSYGSHYDNPIMGGRQPLRSDLSITVFLSEAASYEGGELSLETPYGTKTVKLEAGGAVTYSTLLRHQVMPVTRGERLAAVTWIQSLVKDPARRQILGDIAAAREQLRGLAGAEKADDFLHKTHANLLKMWAEV